MAKPDCNNLYATRTRISELMTFFAYFSTCPDQLSFLSEITPEPFPRVAVPARSSITVTPSYVIKLGIRTVIDTGSLIVFFISSQDPQDNDSHGRDS